MRKPRPKEGDEPGGDADLPSIKTSFKGCLNPLKTSLVPGNERNGSARESEPLPGPGGPRCTCLGDAPGQRCLPQEEPWGPFPPCSHLVRRIRRLLEGSHSASHLSTIFLRRDMSVALPGCAEGLRSRARAPDSKPQDHIEATQLGLQSTVRLGAQPLLVTPRDPSSWDSLSLSIKWERGWGHK